MADKTRLSGAGGGGGSKKFNKRENDEQRKKAEEQAAAMAYEEFVAAFDDAPKVGKMFVRGTTFNAGNRQEQTTKETGKLYKPPKMSDSYYKPPKQESREVRKEREQQESRDEKQKRNKERDKKKSNLELFKEELKIIQEEREERHRLKTQLGKTRFEPAEPVDEKLSPTLSGGPLGNVPMGQQSGLRPWVGFGSGSYDWGDPSTTNLYLGNLNPKMTEQQLCETFGKYGPLASVKIMWPRSEEEKARNRNCGFVAFMTRKDGERALRCLNGKDVMGYEMKLGWGKAIPIPPHPVYIPPAMVELTLPPPPSGLPFNCQPQKEDREKVAPPGLPYPTEGKEKAIFDRVVRHAVVKVVIPTERSLLCLIHRMIEFVLHEGPMFEAMIMNRELNNPMFRFLFENQSPAHVYYRWKLFSILQGDSPSKWQTTEFRMFKGGSLWKPPPMNPYLQGMPDELVDEDDEDETEKAERSKSNERSTSNNSRQKEVRKGELSNTQRDRLEDMLRNLTPERAKIADAMIYCMEHADAAEEIVECIAESLSIVTTPLIKKVARLYLISDILHNSAARVTNASFYRKQFQSKLPDICKDVHRAYHAIEGRLKAEQFKQKVVSCFRAWEEWAIYPNDFLIKLQNVFLGLVPVPMKLEVPEVEPEEVDGHPLDLDGAPLEDDLDGVPIAASRGVPGDVDLDGVPITEDDPDLDGVPIGDDSDSMDDRKSAAAKAKYVPCKWETVDPELIQAQAMTTSKWDLLDQQDDSKEKGESGDEDVDGKPLVEYDDIDGVEMEEEATKDSLQTRTEAFLLSLRESSSNSGTPGRSQHSDPLGDISFRSGEERRLKLREIELKVVKYQDEVESGKRSRKSGMTVAEQVEHYRQKLLRKERDRERDDDGHREKERSRRRSPSPLTPGHGKERNRKRSYSPDSGREKSRRKASPSPPDTPKDRRAGHSPSPEGGGKYKRSPSPETPGAGRRGYVPSPERAPPRERDWRPRYASPSPPPQPAASLYSSSKRGRSRSPPSSGGGTPRTPGSARNPRSRSRSPGSSRRSGRSSPSRRHRSRSRSPKRHRKSRSNSPALPFKKRSPSKSPPPRKSHKSKKSKY